MADKNRCNVDNRANEGQQNIKHTSYKWQQKRYPWRLRKTKKLALLIKLRMARKGGCFNSEIMYRIKTTKSKSISEESEMFY